MLTLLLDDHHLYMCEVLRVTAGLQKAIAARSWLVVNHAIGGSVQLHGETMMCDVSSSTSTKGKFLQS